MSGDVTAPRSRARLALSVQRSLKRAESVHAPYAVALRRWAKAALRERDVEATVRLVGAEEGQALNRDYRGRDYATNVLTFVYGEMPGMPEIPLCGDIVLCVPVVMREAEEQGKSLEAHFAHLMVHGMLHLQGFDHEEPAEAETMEALEVAILAGLGYGNPYL